MGLAMLRLTGDFVKPDPDKPDPDKPLGPPVQKLASIAKKILFEQHE
jgi:hypothetical protein